MNIKDFKVGQTVFIELTGNDCRGKTREQCIEEWEITSVGKKYIKAARKREDRPWGEVTFEYRETYGKFVQKTNYCVDYILYATRKEIEDKHEKSMLFDKVSEVFRGYGASRKITLEQLRKINAILEEKSEVQNANS